MPFSEETLVNTIAKHERAIAGVKHSFDYAKNPDTILGQTPCVIHYPPGFFSEPAAHHNVWSDQIEIRSILFVMPHEAQGARLRYVENAALPFGHLWRQRFRQEAVVSDLLSQTAGMRVFLSGGNYGVGTPELTFGGTPFVGWVLRFTCKTTGQ